MTYRRSHCKMVDTPTVILPSCYIGPLDFHVMTTALVLAPTEERVCLNITIRDDRVDEREERFSVVIQSVPAGVIVSRHRTTVIIFILQIQVLSCCDHSCCFQVCIKAISVAIPAMLPSLTSNPFCGTKHLLNAIKMPNICNCFHINMFCSCLWQ